MSKVAEKMEEVGKLLLKRGERIGLAFASH